MPDEDQVWTVEHEGLRHRVEAGLAASHHVRWHVDGQLVAEKKTIEDRVALEHGGTRMTVRYSGLGTPRRATLGGGALGALGGIDLTPAPDSPAAAYERRVLEHPARYAVVATLGGVAKVVVPILLGLIAVRFAVHIPWPDLPSLPLPDLPSIPWPDLPSIPWPGLPDVSLPYWVRWVLDKAKYVWPVLLAFGLARAEIKRRQAQERRRRERDEGTNLA